MPHAADPLADPASAGFDGLFASNVLIVTGKGGVGKTTGAAALALAAVASGRRTLLVEVEGRQGFSRTFGTAPWDYQEREFRPGLWGASLDAAESVYEYLELFYGLKRMQWVMERSNALDFVTTAAPGLRDLLLVGKIYEIEGRRRPDGRRAYDTIIVDAPPTGRILPFLQAPEGVTEIVRVGPIRRQAGQIKEMLTDPHRVRGVIVTLLEEMPIREATEGVLALREAGVATGPVLANQVVVPRVRAEDLVPLDTLGGDGLRERVEAHGARMSGRTAELSLMLAHDHVARVGHQQHLRRGLADDADVPVLSLPLMAGRTFDVDDLQILGDVLALQVGEAGPHAEDRFDERFLTTLASGLDSEVAFDRTAAGHDADEPAAEGGA